MGVLEDGFGFGIGFYGTWVLSLGLWDMGMARMGLGFWDIGLALGRIGHRFGVGFGGTRFVAYGDLNGFGGPGFLSQG